MNCSEEEILLLSSAVDDYLAIRTQPTTYPDSLAVAAQLKSMGVDVPTLVAALLGSDISERFYTSENVALRYNEECRKVIDEVRWLNQLNVVDIDPDGNTSLGSRDQAEMLRRMLLTIIEDMRVVLVKLAFRTQRLYECVKDGDDAITESSIGVARETLSIYAPVANRLGLGQLKWELEDIAFRIVDPAAYKRVAKALEENRASREIYIHSFVETLAAELRTNAIDSAQVFGRPKHLYSIWRKMRLKRIEFNDLFDVRAVRILVSDLKHCYTALGVVHSMWQPITREFDDYIANPKDNGYQSLHTAVIGPDGKAVEVQIRTIDMNESAENGIAAHWAYKEGRAVDLNQQKNLNNLKQLLDEADDDQIVEGLTQQLDSSRVYIFTPKGDVIDLVTGSTPLDFAYHVHSEIGHRCRGAKVNGRIVPLTYHLQNGDQVEVLTTREPGPSRDWLNKNSGYLKSSRARSKVRSWFHSQDHAQHVADGRVILDREMRRLKTVSVSIDGIAERLNYEKPADLFASIGRNEVTIPQIVGAIDHLATPLDKMPEIIPRRLRKPSQSSGVQVSGVGSLLTTMANCCQPVPHDAIVGFITKGSGVSVHREDCSNMLNLREAERERLIDVSWGEDNKGQYRVEIRIQAIDRHGLLRDVSTCLSNYKVDVVESSTKTDESDQTAEMRLTLHVSSIADLTSVMASVRQLRNVQTVERVV